MMTPASIAHRLSGKVWKIDGQPAAGAQLRIVNAAGQEVAPPVTTGGDGRYETTLPRGDYRVTVLPDGVYMPDAGAGCTIVAFTCALGLRQNRVIDFYGVPTGPIVVPRPPVVGDRRDAENRQGPVFRVPRANSAVAASRAGVVGVKLGPFSEDASGTVALQQPGTTARPRGRARGRGRSRARAVASAAAVALGSRSFRVRAGGSVVVAVTLNRRAQRLLRQRRSIRAVAVVTARDAAGNATVMRFALTLKAARASARRARRGRRGR